MALHLAGIDSSRMILAKICRTLTRCRCLEYSQGSRRPALLEEVLVYVLMIQEKSELAYLFSFSSCIEGSDIKEIDALFECILNRLEGCFLVWRLHK